MTLDELRDWSPAHYFAAITVPSAHAAVQALWALESELNAVPARVTQPAAGLIRVTWWRDAVREGKTTHIILKDLYLHFGAQADVLADFIDTFGAPFEDDVTAHSHLAIRDELRTTLLRMALGDAGGRAGRIIEQVGALRRQSVFYWLRAVWTTWRIVLN
jgi:hypothetical protein